jgi:hypothetical protein
MEPIPHARGRYSHAESMFDATRSGIDDAYAFVRRAVGEVHGAELVGDVLLILAGNAVRHSPAGAGGQFAVQIAALPGHWKLRIDDDRGSVEGPQLLLGERGDPLHGLVALNRAGVQWTLPGPGAILAEINCPLPDEIPADLSVPAKRAVASVR